MGLAGDWLACESAGAVCVGGSGPVAAEHSHVFVVHDGPCVAVVSVSLVEGLHFGSEVCPDHAESCGLGGATGLASDLSQNCR